MSTSNSYSFTVSASDIVNAALRTLQVIDQQATANSYDLTFGIQALNLLLKSFATQGLPLWAIEWIQVPMVASQTSYTIGPGGNVNLSYRPTRLFSAFLRTTSSNTDVTLLVISRQEYEILGSKLDTSIPNQVYYDNQLALPVAYFFNVPVDNSTVAWLSMQRPLQDIVNTTDNFDVPQEWFMFLKWALAEELLLEYSVPSSVSQLVLRQAERYREQAFNMSQEEASVYFSVDPNAYYYRGVPV